MPSRLLDILRLGPGLLWHLHVPILLPAVFLFASFTFFIPHAPVCVHRFSWPPRYTAPHWGESLCSTLDLVPIRTSWFPDRSSCCFHYLNHGVDCYPFPFCSGSLLISFQTSCHFSSSDTRYPLFAALFFRAFSIIHLNLTARGIAKYYHSSLFFLFFLSLLSRWSPSSYPYCYLLSFVSLMFLTHFSPHIFLWFAIFRHWVSIRSLWYFSINLSSVLAGHFLADSVDDGIGLTF